MSVSNTDHQSVKTDLPLTEITSIRLAMSAEKVLAMGVGRTETERMDLFLRFTDRLMPYSDFLDHLYRKGAILRRDEIRFKLIKWEDLAMEQTLPGSNKAKVV